MKYRGSIKAWTLAAALAAGMLPTASAAEALRFCADPDNLPFSKEQGAERGMYVELAELVAQKMGAPIEFTWWYTHNQRRALRNTVGANAQCDVVVALPADYRARTLVQTKPFMQVGYAVVAAPSYQFKTLDDLRARRIGVQFGTTPHIVLNTLEGFRSSTYRSSDEIFAALAKGEVEIAMLWGPQAGYENKKLHAERWRVTPVAGHDFAGEVSMAVRKERQDLVKPIEAALASLAPEIARLADKYGFPRAKPIELATASAAHLVPAGLVVAVNDPAKKAPAKAAPAKTAPAKDAPPAAAAPADATVQAGRVRFNDQCSHCHGQDGFSPVRERDLRRLTSRYDAKWTEVALTTIKNGRVELGMPAWKEILKEPEIAEVMAFLKTVQK